MSDTPHDPIDTPQDPADAQGSVPAAEAPETAAQIAEAEASPSASSEAPLAAPAPAAEVAGAAAPSAAPAPASAPLFPAANAAPPVAAGPPAAHAAPPALGGHPAQATYPGPAGHATHASHSGPASYPGVAGSAPGAAFRAPAKPVKPARKGPTTLGVVAAVAIAALLGGASGGLGVYAALQANAPQSQSEQAPVGTNLMVNDLQNVTAITGVAATVAPSVVTLSVTGTNAQGTGSGVVLTEDGYILTNAHVATLEGETSDPTITVQSYDGRLFNATLVGSDPRADLAVIKVDSDVLFQPVTFADSSKLNVGDTAIAIGAPLGLSNTVTTGVVSALNRSITIASSAAPDSEAAPSTPKEGDDPFGFWKFDNGRETPGNTNVSSTIALPVVQTDAAINPGNSGGALLDGKGKVIGINVAIAGTGGQSAGSIGVGFAIPSNLAKRVAFELIEHGTASHGLLGATIADVTDDTSIKDSPIMGAAVQSVTAGGAAEAAGIRKGDIITRFDGLPIINKTDLTAQVGALPGGSTVEVVYVRAGKTVTVSVTLGQL